MPDPMLETLNKGELTLHACDAMATRFEFALHGGDPSRLRAAAEEAIREIRRVERRLSFRMLTSEINELNRSAGVRPVKVDPQVFELLMRAREWSAETLGTFDPTVGPLMDCWGLASEAGVAPDDQAVEAAKRIVGIGNVEFDEDAFAVFLPMKGMKFDCGSIGKGYAMDLAAAVLDEAGIGNGFLQGGTSTIVARGNAADGARWKVGVAPPEWAAGPTGALESIATFELCDESLSVSGIAGRTVEWGGRTYGHVIDPRSGRPVEGALLAAVVLPSAAETDALSTALLVDGVGGVGRLRENRPRMRGLLALPDEGPPGYRCVGF